MKKTEEEEDNYKELIAMINSLQQLDFSFRIEAKSNNYSDLVDGLNELGEKLERDVVERSYLTASINKLNTVSKEFSYCKYALNQSAIVSITDLNGTIEHVNQLFCNVSKYTKEELIGQNQNILNSGHHSTEFWKNMWDTISDGKVWKKSIKNIAKDKSYYWLDTTILPFLDKNDKPEKFISVQINITEEKNNSDLLEQRHREAIRYQIKLLSSQLNPNFIYTSMNSLQHSILDHNIEYAMNYIADFSNLLRTVMQNSAHLYISLEEEVYFLTKFLEMEKERNNNSFDYSINTGNLSISNNFIPPMILQPYIENAVIHGVSGVENGVISITFSKQDDYLLCSVEDNGIGRDNAMMTYKTRSDSSKPRGIGISEIRLKLYSELEKHEFFIKTIDKKDQSGAPVGTEIKLFIPSKSKLGKN